MKAFLKFATLMGICLLIFGCPKIDPVGDTVAPELNILVRQPNNSGPAKIIASSDTDKELSALGCPSSTLLAGQFPNSYFTNLPRTVGLTVISRDEGGVRNMYIELQGSVNLQDVTNVTTVNDPGADIITTQLNPVQVGINITFSNLRTAQIVTLDVAAEDEGLIVLAESADFNAHSTSLPQGQSGGDDHGGQILNITNCQ